MGLDKDLASIQDSRALVNAAHEAWKTWSQASPADVHGHRGPGRRSLDHGLRQYAGEELT